MKRIAAVVVLLGFLAYSGIYVFVYLFRAFRLPEPVTAGTVNVWHGDPMTRAVLVAVLFAVGLILLLFVFLNRSTYLRAGSVRLRPDLFDWVRTRAEMTNEDPDALAERAIAVYRAAIEEGRPATSRR